jgi:type IV pilus assembly protein PilV
MIRRTSQRGASLIEILITLLISTFGLLGLAAFISRSTTLSADAAQRARALTLVNDMAQRLVSNRAAADSYVLTGSVGSTSSSNCAGNLATRDVCEWTNLLNGTQDAQTGSAAFMGFRGCITKPLAISPVYIVTVAWGSLSSGFPPEDTCAKGDFGSDDTRRRVVRQVVRIANLS